jgi:drug/metabolite transporter (DMT)-like permease
MGILLAFTALLSWGLGDFLIQRSARQFGDWITLFYITAFGSIVLFPFIYQELATSLSLHAALLIATGFVILVAALLDLEALRVGKISVVEPMYALEIPVTAILAACVIHERLSIVQAIFIVTLMIGIVLISVRSTHYFKNFKPEKGVWYALLATICMGAANFFFGLGSRETSPLVINWFADLFIAVIALVYLISSSRMTEVANDLKRNKRLIFNVSFFDNLAWVTFSYAMLFIPIAIATGISEGYIAFAAGLGMLFNAERLKRHQWVGFALTTASVIALAILMEK